MARPRLHPNLDESQRQLLTRLVGGTEIVKLAVHFAAPRHEAYVLDAALRRVAVGVKKGERPREEFLRGAFQAALQVDTTRLGLRRGVDPSDPQWRARAHSIPPDDERVLEAARRLLPPHLLPRFMEATVEAISDALLVEDILERRRRASLARRTSSRPYSPRKVDKPVDGRILALRLAHEFAFRLAVGDADYYPKLRYWAPKCRPRRDDPVFKQILATYPEVLDHVLRLKDGSTSSPWSPREAEAFVRDISAGIWKQARSGRLRIPISAALHGLVRLRLDPGSKLRNRTVSRSYPSAQDNKEGRNYVREVDPQELNEKRIWSTAVRDGDPGSIKIILARISDPLIKQWRSEADPARVPEDAEDEIAGSEIEHRQRETRRDRLLRIGSSNPKLRRQYSRHAHRACREFSEFIHVGCRGWIYVGYGLFKKRPGLRGGYRQCLLTEAGFMDAEERIPVDVVGDIAMSVGVFRKGASREKANVIESACAHLDLDLPEELNGPEAKEAAIKRLESESFSLVLDTGRNLAGYLQLTQPARGDDLRRLEALNWKLATIFGGDDTYDLNRIMRVPGTVNQKNGRRAEILRERSSWKRYDLDDLCRRFAVNDGDVSPTWETSTRRPQRSEVSDEDRVLPGERLRRVYLNEVVVTSLLRRLYPGFRAALLEIALGKRDARYYASGSNRVSPLKRDLGFIATCVSAKLSDDEIGGLYRGLLASRYWKLVDDRGESEARGYLQGMIKTARETTRVPQ